MNEKKTLVVIGAGGRGNAYSRIAMESDKFEVVAVAEPIKKRREFVAKRHNIPKERTFETWEDLLPLGKIADAAIIATMDRDHLAPAIAALEAGYDLLLEKPVAPTPEDCRKIEECARKNNKKVLICHVLRYTPFYRAIKNALDSGMVGRIMHVYAAEGVGNVHQSHSFVRGNWGNSERSSFMLLQKSCHDLDILQWLIGKECKKVQSFGHLSYFTAENAPEGSPERCIDGCPHADTCPYNAVKLYLTDKEHDKSLWFRTSAAKSFEPTDEEIENVLRTTNYGKCVFKCDNDVVDHQIVNMEFEDDVICSFNMAAFNLGGRKLCIMGTKGEIVASADKTSFTYTDLITQTSREIEIADMITDDSIVGGHGGGDGGIINSFYDMLCGKIDPSLSNIEISVKNHMIAFAAEKSRLEGRVVDLSEMN